MSIFSSPEIRREFIIGITEILAQIYKVSDDSLKLSIFNELNPLSDEELIAKKDLVERYLEETIQLTQTYMNKMVRAENEYKEEEERKKETSFVF
ncbi:MAG: hypothetical protein PHH70_03925 [Candidatus Gracilibacteria bacterium]|nr:hypothetical protein [Candidatus Gracilibacteria bacterium]